MEDNRNSNQGNSNSENYLNKVGKDFSGANRPGDYGSSHYSIKDVEWPPRDSSGHSSSEHHHHSSSSSGHHHSSSGGHHHSSSSHHHSSHHHHRRKKKNSAGKKVAIALVAFFLVIVLAVGGVGYYYLSLIDYDDGTKLTMAPVKPSESSDVTAATDDNGNTLPAENNDDPEGDNSDNAIADILNGEKADELSDEEKEKLAEANKNINANLDNNQMWQSKDVTNILLMGIDYGDRNFPYGRSDAMIVISINRAVKKVKMVSLSRAVYAAIPGYNNTRLSHAHGYGGPQLAIQAVQNNYKIKIDNYASVTFQGFKNIIDALGGVTVDLDGKEANSLRRYLGSSSAGTYHLNGEQALAFARKRKIDTDRNRTGRQRRILEALAEKGKKMTVPQMMSAMNQILPNVKTDMDKSELISLLSKAVTYLGYDIEEHIIPVNAPSLTLRGRFEVLILNWEEELQNVHDIFYEGAKAETVS